MNDQIRDGQHKVKQKQCSICGLMYIGWGNNAQPVNDGRCCDACNKAHVLPARLARFHLGQNPTRK